MNPVTISTGILFLWATHSLGDAWVTETWFQLYFHTIMYIRITALIIVLFVTITTEALLFVGHAFSGGCADHKKILFQLTAYTFILSYYYLHQCYELH